MDEASVKRALVDAIQEGAIQELISTQMREAVKSAVKEALTQQNAEIKSLKEELKESREENKQTREELKETREQLNDLEQYSRRLCLNISGIPEGGASEVTERLVIDTAKLAGVNVAPLDIDTSHRIGTAQPGKDRTIIVRFNSFKTRQEMYSARKELRKPRPVPGSSVSAEAAKKVFLSDNLTRANQFLLYQARQLKKANKIWAAWSDVGRLKIRVKENGPTKIIKSLDDLEKHAGVLPRDLAPDVPDRRVTRQQNRGGH